MKNEMSLTRAEKIECPYCMTYNDIEIDEVNDINQQLIIDCQICCSPIEITVIEGAYGIEIIARTDDE